MNTMTKGAISAVARLQTMQTDLRTRAAEERGAVMAEYGLLLAVIALAIIATLVLFRDELTSVFSKATNTLNTADEANLNP